MWEGAPPPPPAKIIIIIIIKDYLKTFLNSWINALFLEDNIKQFLDTINGLQLQKTHVIMIFILYYHYARQYMANWNWIIFF